MAVIFPNDQAVIRLASALLLEQNDEWLVRQRYLSAESLAVGLTEPTAITGTTVEDLPVAA